MAKQRSSRLLLSRGNRGTLKEENTAGFMGKWCIVVINRSLDEQDVTCGPHELTRQEGKELFDRAARANLGISGAEFRRKWAAGEYKGEPEQPRVMLVAMLMDLER